MKLEDVRTFNRKDPGQQAPTPSVGTYTPPVVTATRFGTVTVEDEGFGPLSLIPVESPQGLLLRAVHVGVGQAVRPNQSNFWTLQVGTLLGSTFSVLREFPLQDGLQRGVTRFALGGGLRVPRQTLVALRAVQRGTTAPLVGLSVLPEYGILGARR